MAQTAAQPNRVAPFMNRLLLGFLVFGFIFVVFLRAFWNWLKGVNERDDSGLAVLTQHYTVSPLATIALRNDAIVTCVTQTDPLTAMMTSASFELQLRVQQPCTLHVLQDVPLDTFHAALVKRTDDLRAFVTDFEVNLFPLCRGQKNLQFTLTGLNIPDNEIKRDQYSLVLVISMTPSTSEKIVLSCYVVHVKMRTEESVDTTVLYTFWKTNYNRLLLPQVLFAAHESDVSSMASGDHVVVPTSGVEHLTCFVCLLTDASTGLLRVLLPCRHAAVCHNCFTSLQTQAFSGPLGRLTGIVACPICRTPVNALLCLPSSAEE